MPLSTHQKLAALRNKLATTPHEEVLRTYLHQNENELFKSAILVSIYRTWESTPPFALASIGITLYDRRAVNMGLPLAPGPHAENMLDQIWCMSLQIEPDHLHLGDNYHNRSAGFQFGTTVYTTKAEAEEALHQICQQDIDDERAEEGIRPVILLSFNNNEAIAKVRKPAFDFIPSSLPNTIATLDAQVIACQAKITSDHNATLRHVLAVFNINCPDLANAGNTATLSMVASILSVLRRQLYEAENNKGVRPGQYGISRERSAQEVIQSLVCRKTPAPPFGTPA